MLRRSGARRLRVRRPHNGRGTVSLGVIGLVLAGFIGAVGAAARDPAVPVPTVARHDSLPLLGTPGPADDIDTVTGSAADAVAPRGDDPTTGTGPPGMLPADAARLRAIAPVVPPAVKGPAGMNVPILMYHFIRVAQPVDGRLGFNLSVTPADLADQLALLRRDGFTGVSIGQVMDAMEGGAPLPGRPIVLTFDDGFVDFATTAVPLLRAAGFTATDFVVSGFINKPGYMSADQVKDIVARGMTVGAHTVHHVDLAIQTPANAAAEITASRTELRALTGAEVTDFAYPSGRFTPAVVDMVARAGFRDAVTTIPGAVLNPGLPLTMPRVRVAGGESLAAFADALRAAPGQPTGPAPTATPIPLVVGSAAPGTGASTPAAFPGGSRPSSGGRRRS